MRIVFFIIVSVLAILTVIWRYWSSILFFFSTYHQVKNTWMGVVVSRHPSGGAVFWGRSNIARHVIAKYCEGRYKSYFGGYYVPDNDRLAVTSAISHDPQDPQAIHINAFI